MTFDNHHNQTVSHQIEDLHEEYDDQDNVLITPIEILGETYIITIEAEGVGELAMETPLNVSGQPSKNQRV